MKPEDVYDGVTNIRDDLIDNARKPKKRKILYSALAAVVAVAVIAGGAAALWQRSDSTGDSRAGTSTGHGDLAVTTLVRAVYPDRPPYPETDEYGEAVSEKEFDAWWEDSRARSLSREERAALAGWKPDLLQALLRGSGDGNAVCSPVGVYLALGMLTEVTDGESRQQILDALGADSGETLRERANRIWNAVYNDDGTYTLDLAASVWLRNGFDYEAGPLKRLAESWYASGFSGEMGSPEYNGTLRGWLNDHTGGLLEDAVEGVGLDTDTAMALATTVFFKDRWKIQFSSDKTDTGVFHAPSGDAEREFMHCTEFGSYFWSDKFAGIALGFKSGGGMYLLLPDEGVTLEEILEDPAAAAFLTEMDETEGVESKSMKINVSLPKFDVTQDGEIGERIRELGVTDVFDRERADFSPLTGGGGDVWLSRVLHGARVTVDEEGCVGAAYTVMATTGAAQPPDDTVDIVFDRPFLFSVVNEGVPIFAGVVNEP